MKGRLPLEHPKVAARVSNFASERFIGTIMDLLKLTFSPVNVEKLLIRDFMKNNCLTSPSITIKVSSAYWMIGKSLVEFSEDRQPEQTHL